MRLCYLIRHGETDWNKIGRYQGHSDIELNSKGISQARALKHILKDKQISKAIASDLIRAQQTAQESLFLHHTDHRLREIHLGEAEGLTYEEVSDKFITPDRPDFVDNWRSHRIETFDFRFPSGESKWELVRRMQDSIKHWLETYPNETLAFFSHGMAIRSLIHSVRPDLPKPLWLENCAVVPLHVDLRSSQFVYQGPENPEELEFPKLSDID